MGSIRDEELKLLPKALQNHFHDVKFSASSDASVEVNSWDVTVYTSTGDRTSTTRLLAYLNATPLKEVPENARKTS